MLSVNLLSLFIGCFAHCGYDECHYAECQYAECRFAMRRGSCGTCVLSFSEFFQHFKFLKVNFNFFFI
jgi:hypothetical protein